MRFSQRLGITPATKVIQREDIDAELRNTLWSVITLVYWDRYRAPGDSMYGRADFVRSSNYEDLITALWLHFFKRPVDTIDTYWEHCLKKLRAYFFEAKWFEVYDFIEFLASAGPKGLRDDFIDICNSHLTKENSAYRFVEGKITEITSAQEIEAIESALSDSAPFAGVKAHLSSALSHLSSRTNPDYRNSIKESISAVESLAKQLAKDDNATLGAVLKDLEKNKQLHPALKSAFSSLYGYTNDAQGIRHALLDEPNLTKADAKFMLVCCSAFVNFAIEAISK